MKNPNSPIRRLKAEVIARWKSPDYPGGEARFQVRLFVKDVGIFIALPIVAIFVSRSFSAIGAPAKRPSNRQNSVEAPRFDGSKSQVIEFKERSLSVGGNSSARRAPGTLVRLRLLNVVEAYSATPVHAQIVDAGLGQGFLGGILIGDGASDLNFERINITFHIARNPSLDAVAFPISARALSLNGTLGVEALKKEGAFARSAFSAGSRGANEVQGNVEAMDLRTIVVKALTAGLAQEFGSGSQVEQNRAEVLTLKPGTEFFAELTDYFPAGGK